MADVLSQKQIDELLNSFNTQGSNAFEEIEEKDDKNVKSYDFKTPKKFTKEQLKVIDNIFELPNGTYAHLLPCGGNADRGAEVL